MEEDDLRSYFSQFGNITDLVRMTDKPTGEIFTDTRVVTLDTGTYSTWGLSHSIYLITVARSIDFKDPAKAPKIVGS